MKITRTNKEYGYTIGFSCSECGANLCDKFVHEVLND